MQALLALAPRHARALRALAAELVGTAVFHFVGSAAPTPGANAASLAVLVYYSAKLSGAHLNPAATLAFCALGHTGPLLAALYCAAQLLGALLGALALALLVPGLSPGAAPQGAGPLLVSGCLLPSPGLSLGQVAAWEAAGTFAFLLPVFSVVWYTQAKSGYGNTGPLIVGLSLYAAASAVGPYTGGVLDPARAVASAIVMRCPSGAAELLVAYVGGQLAGAALVPALVVPWYGVAQRPWWRRRAALTPPPPQLQEVDIAYGFSRQLSVLAYGCSQHPPVSGAASGSEPASVECTTLDGLQWRARVSLDGLTKTSSHATCGP